MPRRPRASAPGAAPPARAAAPAPLVTPDGRYLVVRGRLWRRTDPTLAPAARAELVGALMAARRGVRDAVRADDPTAERAHRAAVHAAKVGLGERGPVWWDDGAPDYTRRLARNTPYAAWWTAVAPDVEGGGRGAGRAAADGAPADGADGDGMDGSPDAAPVR